MRALLIDLGTPFGVREAIVNIVTMGSLPLWFWDKSDPQRSILFASQVSRCDWLSLMADADLKGRICQDSQKFADSIALFEECCREQGCWDRPFAFASDHSRYIYFQKEGADPYYEAYDTTQFEVILTCAIPGTGKDYWIQQHHPDLPVVSLDSLRTALRVGPTGDQSGVVRAAHALARSYLQQHTPFIWNATNVMGSQRRSLVELFANYGARVRMVYLEVSPERVDRQNRDRERVVPAGVIDRFRRRMEIPNLTEAHRVNWIVDC